MLFTLSPNHLIKGIVVNLLELLQDAFRHHTHGSMPNTTLEIDAFRHYAHDFMPNITLEIDSRQSFRYRVRMELKSTLTMPDLRIN